MLETLLLFCSILFTQNVQTQQIQNGCNCPKFSNVALSQLLGNNLLNQRTVNNAQSIDLQSNLGLPTQSGQLASGTFINGFNLNNIGSAGNDFLFSSNLAANKCPKAAHVLKTNNNLPSLLANPFFNDLLTHALSAKTCNTPTIKSTIQNKLLNNGVQYNVGIQIDKKDLFKRIMNNGAIKGNMEILKLLQGSTVPVENGMSFDSNHYNNIKMLNEAINMGDQYTNINMQPDEFLLSLQGISDNNAIHYIENMAMQPDFPIANNVILSPQQSIDQIPIIGNNVPFANEMYLQNDNIGMERPIPIARGIQLANQQPNIHFTNKNTMRNDMYEDVINNALFNNIVETNSNPLFDNLFVTNTMPLGNNRFVNDASYGNLYNPNINMPNNILLNTNEFISNNQIPLNNFPNRVQVPNLEFNLPKPGIQYTEDIGNLNGLALNNFINSNTEEFVPIPLSVIPKTNLINNFPISENLYDDQALINFPVTLAQLEESLGNIHLSMPAKLADWNTLNLGQYGCLPIINGLPVAGITETITVMNPNI